MTKQAARIKVRGQQRREIDIDQMVHIIIALGREMETHRKRKAAETGSTTSETGVAA
ncbi:hypothetical protein ACIBEJ_10245 [Nonomuraea sp. NPDC050790]|uniref:hypothetical protein n=1 Tax=Nonomuraea sp. NPDC050790 TaxID=3364371 RepID=UPI0037989752